MWLCAITKARRARLLVLSDISCFALSCTLLIDLCIFPHIVLSLREKRMSKPGFPLHPLHPTWAVPRYSRTRRGVEKSRGGLHARYSLPLPLPFFINNFNFSFFDCFFFPFFIFKFRFFHFPLHFPSSFCICFHVDWRGHTVFPFDFDVDGSSRRLDVVPVKRYITFPACLIAHGIEFEHTLSQDHVFYQIFIANLIKQGVKRR